MINRGLVNCCCSSLFIVFLRQKRISKYSPYFQSQKLVFTVFQLSLLSFRFNQQPVLLNMKQLFWFLLGGKHRQFTWRLLHFSADSNTAVPVSLSSSICQRLYHKKSQSTLSNAFSRFSLQMTQGILALYLEPMNSFATRTSSRICSPL